MDEKDTALLDAVQDDFPLDPRPFAGIGERIGMTESEVIERLAALKTDGVIRRIGASFDSRKLGYVSTLVAARVDEDRLVEVAEQINAYPGVTHNYQREDEYNLWFTLTTRDKAARRKILETVRGIEGVREIQDLPATRFFKLKVKFDTGK